MFHGKHCFRWPESIYAVIQYVLKQRDIVEKLTVSVLGVNLFYTQTSICGPGRDLQAPENVLLFRGAS